MGKAARSIEESSGQVRQKRSRMRKRTHFPWLYCAEAVLQGLQKTDPSRVEESTWVSYIVVVCLRDGFYTYFLFPVVG